MSRKILSILIVIGLVVLAVYAYSAGYIKSGLLGLGLFLQTPFPLWVAILAVVAAALLISSVHGRIGHTVSMWIKYRTIKGAALLEASEEGDSQKMWSLVQLGADVNVNDRQGRTPLSWAARRNDWEDVSFLIESGADVNFGETPLFWAADHCRLDIVRYLVAKGVGVNVTADAGKTPLLAAAGHSQLDIVKYLVDNGADVNARDEYGRTPLFAAANGITPAALDVVKYLVEQGADLNATTCAKEGRSATETVECVGARSTFCSKKDFTKCSNCTGSGETPLFAAVGNYQLEMVKYLVNRGADLKARNKCDQTLLFAAVRGNTPVALDMVKYLVADGCGVNERDIEGSTPLHPAACSGGLQIVKYLVEQGADVNAKTNDGDQPLHDALDLTLRDLASKADGCENDHWFEGFEIAKYLVDRGADVNATYHLGCRPLCRLIGHQDMVKFLVENGADVNAKDDGTGTTPLHQAARFNDLDIVKYIVEKGANIQAKDSNDATPLHYAALLNYSDWLKHRYSSFRWESMLAESGGSVESVRERAGHNQMDVVKHLLDKGADVNAKDANGSTPLHLSVEGNWIDVVKCLVEHGADVNAKNNRVVTALGEAKALKHAEVADFLIEHGAKE